MLLVLPARGHKRSHEAAERVQVGCAWSNARGLPPPGARRDRRDARQRVDPLGQRLTCLISVAELTHEASSEGEDFARYAQHEAVSLTRRDRHEAHAAQRLDQRRHEAVLAVPVPESTGVSTPERESLARVGQHTALETTCGHLPHAHAPLEPSPTRVHCLSKELPAAK